MIDLEKLNSNIVEEIKIDTSFTYTSQELENTPIIELNQVKVMGTIKKNHMNENVLTVNIDGEMLLEDAISLKQVKYPFHIELDEVLDNGTENKESDPNTLDLKEILWQNILLEIPLKYTEVEDFSSYQGEGWKLISEEELKDMNNPFNDLKKKLGEE